MKHMLTIVLLLLIGSTSSIAGIQTISYQGRLTDNSGADVADGTYDLTFTIYDTESGGVPLWTSGAQAIEVEDGLFTYVLGSGVPLDSSVFSGSGRHYLGIQVGTGPEGAPRTELHSVPYAMRVSTVDGAKGGTVQGHLTIENDIHSLDHTFGFYYPSNVYFQSDQIGGGKFDIGGFFRFDATTGKLRLGSINHGYHFPQVDGELGQVMATDGAGQLSWTDFSAADSTWRLDGTILETVAHYGMTRGHADNVLFGDSAFTHINLGTNCTTGTAGANAYFAIVAGGYGNTADSSDATVSGGVYNRAMGAASTISGGIANLAFGRYSSIPGGHRNTTSGTYSLAAGRKANAAHDGSFVWADSDDADFVSTDDDQFLVHASGGVGINLNDPTVALEVDGTIKSRSGGFEFPDGTTQSTAAAAGHWTLSDSVLLTRNYLGVGKGGAGNLMFGNARHTHVNLGGVCSTGTTGQNNLFCTMSGGKQNSARASYSTVSGGFSNSARGQFAVISGGQSNTASGENSTIAGGEANEASGNRSGVMAGDNNYAGGNRAFVGGGANNNVPGHYSTVLGGSSNSAEDAYSTVGGGLGNQATNDYATVAGGRYNVASGRYSAVMGGEGSRALADFALAGGNNARANYFGSVVIVANHNIYSSDSTSSGGSEQMVLRADGGLYVTNAGGVASYDDSKLITTVGGAYLSGDGATWTNSSDREKKENFKSVDGGEILELLEQLEITEWNYKSDDDDIRHVGPVAQDFHALFGVGGDDKSISTVDPSGIALAAIKELHKKTKRVDELESEVAELRELVNRLAEKLER